MPRGHSLYLYTGEPCQQFAADPQILSHSFEELQMLSVKIFETLNIVTYFGLPLSQNFVEYRHFTSSIHFQLSLTTLLSILRPQILNFSYTLIFKPQILTFLSCKSQTPNIMLFAKSQTPNIDTDLLYTEVGSIPLVQDIRKTGIVTASDSRCEN